LTSGHAAHAQLSKANVRYISPNIPFIINNLNRDKPNW
jgi:hypothetical protein